MHTYLSAISSISVLVFLIGIITLLRHLNVLKKEDGKLFSKIVMNITLPAVVFFVLSHSKSLEWEYFLIALYIFATEMLVLSLAWGVGKKMNISNAQLGTLMLVSAFGSSALLGYVLIGQIFPSNVEAMSEAVIVSEFGVGIGLFTIGTMIAIHFGSKNSSTQTPLQSLIIFTKSPLFLAIVAGLAYSMLNIPTDIVIIKEVFSTISIIAKANTFFVALTIGVLLEFKGVRSVLPFAIVAIVLKLFVSSMLVWFPISLINMSNPQLEVAMLEASMPSAMLSVVLAAKYGCDAKLASKLVFITTIFSIVTIPLVVGFA
jgi:predicted permease